MNKTIAKKNKLIQELFDDILEYQRLLKIHWPTSRVAGKLLTAILFIERALQKGYHAKFL